MLKKIITLWVTPLIAAVLVVLKAKPVDDKLKELWGDYGPLYAGIAIVGLTILSQFITVVSPFKKYEKWAKNKWYILKLEGDKLIKKYKDQEQVSLSLNIMVPRFRMFYFINPWKSNQKKYRFSFCGWVFKDIWNLGSSRVNKQLKITTKQGVCGRAFKNGNIYGAEFVTKTLPIFNFNEKQIRLTKDLKIVISCPITVVEDTAELQSGKIVGVLNAESDSFGSEQLILDPVKRAILYNELVALSTICSKLM